MSRRLSSSGTPRPSSGSPNGRRPSSSDLDVPIEGGSYCAGVGTEHQDLTSTYCCSV